MMNCHPIQVPHTEHATLKEASQLRFQPDLPPIFSTLFIGNCPSGHWSRKPETHLGLLQPFHPVFTVFLWLHLLTIACIYLFLHTFTINMTYKMLEYISSCNVRYYFSLLCFMRSTDFQIHCMNFRPSQDPQPTLGNSQPSPPPHLDDFLSL